MKKCLRVLLIVLTLFTITQISRENEVFAKTEVYEGYYKYPMGGSETEEFAQKKVLEGALADAARQAGMYFEQSSEVQSGKTTMDVVKIMVSSQIRQMGAPEIKKEILGDVATVFHCRVKAEIDIDAVMNQINHTDNQKLDEIMARNKELEAENKRLTEEIAKNNERYKNATESERQQIRLATKKNEEEYDVLQLVKQGEAAYLKKDYNKAIKFFGEAITLNRMYAPAYKGLGNVYCDRGNYDRAIYEYNQAITLNPMYAPAYNGRGFVYYKKGNYDRAIAEYNQASRLNPIYAPAYHNRGLVYYKKGNYDRAIAEYNQASRLNPIYAPAYHNRGLVYCKKGNYDRAIAEYNQAITLNPKNAIYYNSRANAYYMKDDYDQAIADYNQAITLNSKNAIYYNNRANAYYKKDDYDHAIADYKQALALNPNYENAKKNLQIAENKKRGSSNAPRKQNNASSLPMPSNTPAVKVEGKILTTTSVGTAPKSSVEPRSKI